MREIASRMGWVCGLAGAVLLCGRAGPPEVRADSVNSPNITMNVDTNRSVGAGAGNVSVTVSPITIAETMLAEYASGTGKVIALRVRPGFLFDPSSNVTAQSAGVGFNGAAANTAAVLVPAGVADEQLAFALTSGTSPTAQDIIRINGIKVRIGSAAGAAGPAQTVLAVTTSPAGGSFTNRGILGATITKGAADHLVFSTQPADNQAGAALLPIVRIVDFGGNTVTTGDRTISLALQDNPGAATLASTAVRTTVAGLAAWTTGDALRIDTAADGYTLRASHDGAGFLTSDTVDSQPFAITAGPPGRLEISTQPVDTAAGDVLLVAVTAKDDLGNAITATSVTVTLDLTTNPTDAPLLGASLSKDTVNGVATWDVADQLRVTTAGAGFRLSASGIGDPIESEPFAITPGAPNSVRYLQQPVNVREGATVTPPVRVEIVDAFGNRATAFAGTVELSVVEAPCGGGLSGGTAVASLGVAAFPDLVIDTPCEDDVLKAAAPGLGWGASDPFDVATAANARAIPAALVQVKLGALVKLVATGTFPLPDRTADNPTVGGGSLTVTGTTDTLVQTLPASGWTGLGRRRDGSKGFRFTGPGCPLVVVRANTIKAMCRVSTGLIALPEPGPVGVVLRVGPGTARYCAECGGTPKGDATKVFKRKRCAAPDACR